MRTETIIELAQREMAAARNFLGDDAPAQTVLIPVLHAIQDEFGHIVPETVAALAQELNISQAEVRGVVSFYHDFRLEPAGRHVLKLCRAESCQASGGEDIAARLARHGLACGETSADGSITVESVYCLGNCALSPAAMLDGKLIGRMSEARLDAIVSGARK